MKHLNDDYVLKLYCISCFIIVITGFNKNGIIL